MWPCLVPKEQARIVKLLVERVAYEADEETVMISFRPADIKAHPRSLAQQLEKAAA